MRAPPDAVVFIDQRQCSSNILVIAQKEKSK
jgi:hypothetical protein